MPLFFDALLQDLRFGIRVLRRSPGFTLLTVFLLAMAIGANAAVMSWIEGLLLRPYPAVPKQDRMMSMAGTLSGVPGAAGNAHGISWPDVQDLARNSTLFDSFIVDRITGTTLSIGDHAERATGAIVSSNYFNALGVPLLLGRGFSPEEDTGRNAHPVTVISYELWKRRYNGDPSIIGKTQILSGQPHTIIGVASAGFHGTFIGWSTQFWVPLSMEELFDENGYQLENRTARWIEGYAILKPGVTAQQAQQEVSAIARRLEAAYPETNRGRGVKLYRLWQTPFNNAGTLLPTLGIAFAVALLILVITSANVSNLLLLRVFSRRHEMTVRLALGALTRRLVRQLFTEALILSAAAFVCALVIANWMRDALALLLPARGGMRMNLPGQVDGRVVLAAAGICFIIVFVLALVPAAQVASWDIAGALKLESVGVFGSKGRSTARKALVIVQIGLSFVLLVSTGLLFRSLRQMRNEGPGFSQDNVLITSIDFTSAGYSPQRVATFQDDLTRRVRALPGVQSVAFSRAALFGLRGYSSAKVMEDRSTQSPEDAPTIEYNEIAPEYLKTVGIRVIRGREFTDGDDGNAPAVAVVNEKMVSEFWPNEDPVGRRLKVNGNWLQVVGVAETVRYRSLTETPQPFFYTSLKQGPVGTVLQIRTSAQASTLAQSVRREVRNLDANLALGDLITLREQVERTTAPQSVAVLMVVTFASVALMLAIVGLYGMMSYAVAQDSRELGVRIALGARPGDIIRLVIGRGAAIAIVGLSFGLVIALISSRLFGYLLYRVSARDPLSFAAALAAMFVSIFLACAVPAMRASRTDPMIAMRS